MTREIPVVSGKQAIKAFLKLGYVQTRQKGSHVRLKHPIGENRKPLSIPLHRELKIGLLSDLIKDAGLTIDEFNSLLR